jgi:hypothetical protein
MGATEFKNFQAPKEHLCQLCQRIDTDSIFALTTSKSVCELLNFQNDTKCPFCLFFNNTRVNSHSHLSSEVVTYKLQTVSAKDVFGLEHRLYDTIMFAIILGVIKNSQ